MIIRHGDCIAEMSAMLDEGCVVDAVVTDPPAGISFMGKSWDGDKGGRNQWIHWMQEAATLALELAKPGAHALVWALPRTSHWTATAWENAGWEVRDRVAHLFGTGFPKSHNLPGGLGTALKPACEDWWLLRKPLEGTVAANVLEHGVGALNIDACRVATEDNLGRINNPTATWGTYGSGPNRAALGEVSGRWPANVIHDGSDEVLEAFAQFGERKSSCHVNMSETANHNSVAFGDRAISRAIPGVNTYSDAGTAARFFYSAKASKADRAGSKHPTVKPVSLMRYLCRLVTPPGGTILDPFAGSGTTLEAAALEGFRCIGIEREAEYVADIRRRLERTRAALGLFTTAAE